MKPVAPIEPKPLSPTAYVVISAFGMLLSVFLLFVFVQKAPELVQNGISKVFFYVLLFPLGLSIGAFCFGAMRSYARYRGKALGGVIELGGPVLATLLVIVGGFYLVPPEISQATFPIKIRFRDQSGAPAKGGAVSMFIRNATYNQTVNDQGEASFFEIPIIFRKKPAEITFDSVQSQLTANVIVDVDTPVPLIVKPKIKDIPAPATPTVVFEDSVEEIRSPKEVSAWGKDWSPGTLLCTPDRPAGWTIISTSAVHLESTTERSECGKYTTCGGGESDTPTRVCRIIRVQGHDENRFDGWGRATPSFNVTWHHPR